MRRILFVIALCLMPLRAEALVEVCGNGVDDDSSGGDQACPSPDADGDNYTTDGTGLGYDCDDSNRFIYGGSLVTTGCSAGQFKTCNASTGNYSSCGSICPSGTCYHVNPSGGSDSNAGTSYATAFASWNCISSYTTGTPGCNKHSALACGDSVLFWPGTYSTEHQNSFPSDATVGMMIDGKSCSGNPISFHFLGSTTLTISSTAVAPAAPIFIYNSTGIKILGHENMVITGNHVGGRGGIVVAASNSVEIAGVRAHTNYSDGDNNGSHIHFYGGGSDWVLRHFDLYDMIADSGNATNVCLGIFFGGTNTSIRDGVIRYQSGSTVNCSFSYKHGSYVGGLEFIRNRVNNAPFITSAQGGVETYRYNIAGEVNCGAQHNAGADDCAAFNLGEIGGPTFDGTQEIAYNTIYQGRLYSWFPENDWNSSSVQIDNTGVFGTLAVHHNVVRDNTAGYARAVSMGTVAPYGADADFVALIYGGGYLTEYDNCYYNSTGATLRWGFYPGNSGGSAPNGAWCDFASYSGGTCAPDVSPGFVLTSCSSCTSTNPLFDAYLRATAPACSSYGWDEGAPSTPVSGSGPVRVKATGKGGSKGKGRAPWWLGLH